MKRMRSASSARTRRLCRSRRGRAHRHADRRRTMRSSMTTTALLTRIRLRRSSACGLLRDRREIEIEARKKRRSDCHQHAFLLRLSVRHSLGTQALPGGAARHSRSRIRSESALPVIVNACASSGRPVSSLVEIARHEEAPTSRSSTSTCGESRNSATSSQYGFCKKRESVWIPRFLQPIGSAFELANSSGLLEAPEAARNHRGQSQYPRRCRQRPAARRWRRSGEDDDLQSCSPPWGYFRSVTAAFVLLVTA